MAQNTKVIPADVKLRVLQLWNDGSSAGEIARLLNLTSRNSVIGLVNRAGAQKKRSGKVEGRSPIRSKPFSIRMTKEHAEKKKKFVEKLRVQAIVEAEAPAPLGPIGDYPDSGSYCRFLHGDVGSLTWQVCGHPRHGKTPYCEYHYQKLRDGTSKVKSANTRNYSMVQKQFAPAR